MRHDPGLDRSELQRLIRQDDVRALSRYVETRPTGEQVREHIIHRSAYQLKEADPHSWAIPRLSGPIEIWVNVAIATLYAEFLDIEPGSASARPWSPT